MILLLVLTFPKYFDFYCSKTTSSVISVNGNNAISIFLKLASNLRKRTNILEGTEHHFHYEGCSFIRTHIYSQFESSG
jgi:hypothetical protein